MRRLRARCEVCGEIGLAASDIVVAGTSEPGRARCSFHCPECGRLNVQYCDIGAARLLLLGGARGDTTEVPPARPLELAHLDELRELMERPDFITLLGKTA